MRTDAVPPMGVQHFWVHVRACVQDRVGEYAIKAQAVQKGLVEALSHYYLIQRPHLPTPQTKTPAGGPFIKGRATKWPSKFRPQNVMLPRLAGA